MAGPLLPLLGVVAEFIMANGTRAAAMRYGPKAVEQGLKQIRNRQSAINRRSAKAKQEEGFPNFTREEMLRGQEARKVAARNKRLQQEQPRSRFDEEGFPLDEVPLQFAEGDVVNAGLGSLIGESGRTISNMDRMMADQAARQGMSPAEQRMMMIQKTAADMGRTISDRDAQLFGMGEISFEEAMSRAIPAVDMDKVTMERNMMQQEQMFFPTENSLGRYLAKLQETGLLGPGSETFKENFREKITDPIMQAIENEKERYSDQMSRGFAAGDVVDVDALPKGLKAMYDSGPKGREGVEKIAAKTDKFAEGGAVESEIDKGLEELQGIAPEAMVIQQVMTMVMEMIQSGASEEQIMQALMEMGLDEEDIQQVMMMVAEEMAGQESIDGQLAQMM